jgi:hypothetical protein
VNVDRTTVIEVVVSVGEIITALKALENAPIDVQAMPSTGTGVEVTSFTTRSVKLTFRRKAEVHGV